MSYDYNELVASIGAARRQANDEGITAEARLEHLQAATAGFEELSTHCPMTPLLWIQYARTAFDFLCLASSSASNSKQQASELRLQTLELGLDEFPGSCLLHVYYLHLLRQQQQPENDTQQEEAALNKAIEAVGRGSHRNEGPYVALLYNWQATLLVKQQSATQDTLAKIQDFFVQRSRVPIKDANDSLTADYREFCQHHNLPASEQVVQAMEEGRRLEARVYSRFVSLEDQIDAAMHQEGILARHMIAPVVTTEIPAEWEQQLESSGDQRFGMGLGDAATAQAFVQYALALYKFDANTNSKKRTRKNDDDADPEQLAMERQFPALALAVYERGVAECPTVESLWLSYIRCLLEMIQNTPSQKDSTTTVLAQNRLQSVVQRAVRNCPYSQSLVEQQLHAAFVLAQLKIAILDPDRLLATVSTALDKKFLPGPGPFLALYLQAIRVVKRRILHLLCQPSDNDDVVVTFDQPEPLSSKAAPENLNQETQQEVSDLLEDIADMFEEVETRLRKQHGNWSEGRAALWRERAYSELFLLKPLQRIINEPASVASDEFATSFERCIRVHNPPHPESYLSYIRQYASLTRVASAVDVAHKLRRIRFLYQKGVNSVGRPKTPPVQRSADVLLDFDIALPHLCHEWTQFESMFGTARSLGRAQKIIQRKLQKTQVTPRSKVAEQAPSSSVAQHLVQTASIEEAEQKSPNAVSSQIQPVETSKKRKVGEMEAASLTEVAEASQTDSSKKQKKAATEQESADALPPAVTSQPRFKAHPFTVRVSNLDASTEDMDLVDVFREKCGPVTHARIMREKHNHQYSKGQSKGWGLVQFEERDSVTKVLELNGVLGLNEKIMVIEPWHSPAVALVPPGMNRVKPKGEGKSSKRNQARKELKNAEKRQDNNNTEPTPRAPKMKTEKDTRRKDEPETKGTPHGDVLAFRPRGLGRRGGHQKVRLALKDEKSKKP